MRLVRGDRLSTAQRRHVLAAFVHRWTFENARQTYRGRCPACGYILHHDPRFWDEPGNFNPDRFSSENSVDRHKYAYLPFGAGPRKCIGNTFALIEAQLILATLLKKVRFETVPGYPVEIDPAFTLRVKNGLPMRIRPR